VLTAVVLTNLGEKMSDEEVDELLKAVDTSSGEINYTGMFFDWFIRQMDNG
jgi:Ca2+-binding EF-hand superfamily protein